MDVRYAEWRRSGWWCKHLRGEGGCLPDRCLSPQNGDLPIHLAAACGDPDMVKMLLRGGVGKNLQNEVRGGLMGEGCG